MKSEEKQINLKVENTTVHKILISLLCVFLLGIFTWFYCASDVINYKITIVYIIGQLLVLCFGIKNILPFVYVNGRDIKYQSNIVSFFYKNIKLQDIKKIKICTRTTNLDSDNLLGGEPYDVMICYDKKRKLFVIPMNFTNANRFLNLIRATYGVRIEDKRRSNDKAERSR